MAQKRTKKLRSPDTDILPTQENAKARYEKFHNSEANDAIEDHETYIEAKIKKAMADGKFDNLQGKGKPLDLRRYSEIPEHLRPAYHILKNAGFVPEEVRLKKEMELIKEKIHMQITKGTRQDSKRISRYIPAIQFLHGLQ